MFMYAVISVSSGIVKSLPCIRRKKDVIFQLIFGSFGRAIHMSATKCPSLLSFRGLGICNLQSTSTDLHSGRQAARSLASQKSLKPVEDNRQEPSVVGGNLNPTFDFHIVQYCNLLLHAKLLALHPTHAAPE